jgi:hypothetical protein
MYHYSGCWWCTGTEVEDHRTQDNLVDIVLVQKLEGDLALSGLEGAANELQAGEDWITHMVESFDGKELVLTQDLPALCAEQFAGLQDVQVQMRPVNGAFTAREGEGRVGADRRSERNSSPSDMVVWNIGVLPGFKAIQRVVVTEQILQNPSTNFGW